MVCRMPPAIATNQTDGGENYARARKQNREEQKATALGMVFRYAIRLFEVRIWR
jgi:hypothetical protein